MPLKKKSSLFEGYTDEDSHSHGSHGHPHSDHHSDDSHSHEHLKPKIRNRKIYNKINSLTNFNTVEYGYNDGAVTYHDGGLCHAEDNES